MADRVYRDSKDMGDEPGGGGGLLGCAAQGERLTLEQLLSQQI
jgi:hypothetical protein